MNRIGQVTLGMLILSFVGVIVAAVLLSPGISTPVDQITDTITQTNKTYTLGAAGASIALDGQAYRSAIVSNRTGQQVVPANNYTISNYVVATDGTLQAQLLYNGGVWASSAVNVSGVYEPYGYATDGGTRAVTSLVVLLAALAIGVIALYPVLESKVLENI